DVEVDRDSGTVQILVFFFSSRRRHTRSLRDWSSDVCSSDLKLSAPEGLAASGFSFSRDYKIVAYRAALDDQYAEIYTTSVAPWQGKKLTSMGEQLKGFSLAHREVVSWKSADGTTIEGVLYTPPNFDAKKKY